MAVYSRETYSYDEPFEVNGRIVEVLHHSPTHSRVTVLVERPESVVFTRADSDVSKRMSREAPDHVQSNWAYEEASFTCDADLASGGTCTREVESPDERCWQHDAR
ncbi:hypothetical protein ACFQGT_09900 [Natrialbaceae archaeon GCM10025810]|uniref:hypothetical protein n=1 Tax=Halovalidus salilacus TaxID=3075124 RepID=UPI003618214F